MLIRQELASDIDAIWHVNIDAFGGDTEARLVNMLRASANPFVSLVAEQDGRVVGHIVFTPVELVGAATPLKLLGLGPMAVLPEYQRQGIGTLLVNDGLQRIKEMGYEAVIVLGHPEYYPRFGFVPASRFNIKSEYDVPDEVFMALELVPEALKDKSGVIKYHEAFKQVE